MGFHQPALQEMSPSPSGPAIDERFRSLTASGNQALAAGDDQGAEQLYEEALDEAERLFQSAAEGRVEAILMAPMAFNIACHNLGMVRARTGGPGAARAASILAAERLIERAASASEPLVLRINCLRHLRHTFRLLAEQDSGSAQSGETEPLTARAVAVRDEVMRIAALCLDQRIMTAADQDAVQGQRQGMVPS